MKRLLYPFLVIIFCIPALMPLFHSGFFPMHDDEQIARLYDLDQALRAGQIPPRWVSHLGFGYGYPLFNFYPPLVYYLGEIFHLLGFGFIDSIKIVMGLGFVLAALAMYKWARSIFGKEAGVIAAVLYTYAPYHAVDLYVRGALAEFFCFVFFPLILISAKKMMERTSLRSASVFSISLGALILTHSLMVIPFSIFLAIYLIYLYFINRKHLFFKEIFLIILSGFLAFGLTAYFSLPSILEKNFTLVDTILTRELASYKLHFVYLRQFWDSPWGYGGSLYGLEDGLSFQIGKIHLILGALSLPAAIIIYLLEHVRKRKEALLVGKNYRLAKTPELDVNREVNPKERANLLILFIFLTALSLFLASFHSAPLWDMVKPLWYLQFPWRFIGITIVFISIAAAGSLSVIFDHLTNRFLRFLIVSLISGIIIILNFSFFKPAKYLNLTDAEMTSKEEISWRVSGLSFEFVPKGVKTVLSDINTTQLDITKEEVPAKSYEIIDGDLTVIEDKNLPHQKSYRITAATPGILRINTYNFPGWEATIDGKSETIDDQNKLKLITLEIPEGTHIVNARLTDTSVRIYGNLLSLGSLLVIIILLILGRS